jgi:hypothetical protein
MPEWAKILVSALVGVATGTVLEPLKGWVGRHLTARRARAAIYDELGNLYQVCYLTSRKGDETFCYQALKYNAADTFDFYYQQHREACFLIKDWNGIEGVYQFYKAVRIAALEHGCNPGGAPGHNQRTVEGIVDEFQRRFEMKLIEKDLVIQSAKDGLVSLN